MLIRIETDLITLNTAEVWVVNIITWSGSLMLLFAALWNASIDYTIMNCCSRKFSFLFSFCLSQFETNKLFDV